MESIIERWQNFCEKPPKGFEKYFRQGNGKQSSAVKNENVAEDKKASSSGSAQKPTSTPPSSTTDSGSKSKPNSDWNFGMFGPSTSGSGKSGGTGGAGRPIGGNEGNEKEKWIIIGTMAAVTLLGAATLMEMGYKEIAWKEFVNKYEMTKFKLI